MDRADLYGTNNSGATGLEALRAFVFVIQRVDGAFRLELGVLGLVGNAGGVGGFEVGHATTLSVATSALTAMVVATSALTVTLFVTTAATVTVSRATAVWNDTRQFRKRFI